MRRKESYLNAFITLVIISPSSSLESLKYPWLCSRNSPKIILMAFSMFRLSHFRDFGKRGKKKKLQRKVFIPCCAARKAINNSKLIFLPKRETFLLLLISASKVFEVNSRFKCFFFCVRRAKEKAKKRQEFLSPNVIRKTSSSRCQKIFVIRPKRANFIHFNMRLLI